MTSDKTDEIIELRGERYGDFSHNARISQKLKRLIICDELNYMQRESLEMICLKMSRITNSATNQKDSWLDISGYAKLACSK